MRWLSKIAVLSFTILIACDRQRHEPAGKAVPADAKKVATSTYVKTLQVKGAGPLIDTLREFGYAETVNPRDPKHSVTSLEVASPRTLPAGLKAVFAGARIGETRGVWSCHGTARSACEASEYTFYLQPR
jgi:hypothetical protein